ncbi:glycoside hydrolase family 127 protein [Flavitalea antarctica]
MCCSLRKSGTYLLFITVIFFAGNGSAVAQVDHLVRGSAVKINGFVGEKLANAAANRVFAQDVNRLIEPFRHRDEARCWQTEFWGKWFTSAVLAYRYQPNPASRAVLDKAVADLIKTQTPDGYIGNYKPANLLDQWDIWGRKYCLLGLLDYYDITKDKITLAAASRLADNLLSDLAARGDTIVTKGNHRGMAASSVLEPMCLLYTRTKNKKYLDAAEKIVAQWETPAGPQLISKASVDVASRFPRPAPEKWFSSLQGQKSYEMMSCYEGLLELYRITANPLYKQAVEKTWQNILDTEINAAGSGSAIECWFGGRQLQVNPIYKYQETCVTVTWIKLSQQLLRLTGESKYADAIEIAYYNALLGAMSPDGRHWAQYTPLAGRRMEGEEHCNMGLNCCIASGPRGLFTLPHTTVMSAANGISINFFVDGVYESSTPKRQKVTINQQTQYPRNGNVIAKINLPEAEQFEIKIRVPQWSVNTTMKVNGEPVAAITAGEFRKISRTWKSGDEIEVVFDMNTRLQTLGKNPSYVAFMRGPVLFARDTRLGGPELAAVLKPVKTKEGGFILRDTTSGKKDVWMEVKGLFAPESYPENREKPIQVSLCDYASAGNGTDASYFVVWMPQLVDARFK